MNIKYLLLFFLTIGPYARDMMEKEDKEKKYLLLKLIDKDKNTNDGVDYRNVPCRNPATCQSTCKYRKDGDLCMGCFFQSWETMWVNGRGYCKGGLCTGWFFLQVVPKYYTSFLFSLSSVLFRKNWCNFWQCFRNLLALTGYKCLSEAKAISVYRIVFVHLLGNVHILRNPVLPNSGPPNAELLRIYRSAKHMHTVQVRTGQVKSTKYRSNQDRSSQYM